MNRFSINKCKPGAIVIEGHIQGLSNTRSLGELGISVYVVDKVNCIARYSKYCAKFFFCPDFNKDEFADFLIELAKKENISNWLLLPSNDHAVYTISRFKDKLEEHYKVITPGLDIIENIYDKSKLIKIAKNINIPVPQTKINISNSKEINDFTYPVLLKGKNGLSFYKIFKKKALKAKNENELKLHLNDIEHRYSISNTIIQELIPYSNNKTISFTAFCINGIIEAHWSGIKLREHPLNYGTATFAKSIYNQVCHKQSALLLKFLNYTGICEVEWIQDPRDGKYKLIEINPRTWLWVSLAKYCGIDYVKLLYNWAYNISNKFPSSYHLNRYWINPYSDFIYGIIGMFYFRVNPINYFRSIFYPEKNNALFTGRDHKPGFMYLFNLWNYISNR